MDEKKLNYEHALETLEDIADKMERDDLPLDDLIVYFEKGIKLSEFCLNKIKNMEGKLKKLKEIEKNTELEDIDNIEDIENAKGDKFYDI